MKMRKILFFCAILAFSFFLINSKPYAKNIAIESDGIDTEKTVTNTHDSTLNICYSNCDNVTKNTVVISIEGCNKPNAWQNLYNICPKTILWTLTSRDIVKTDYNINNYFGKIGGLNE